jgi:ketosteroid isomerase-like protein
MTEEIEAVTAAYDAFARGDLDAAVAKLADDVVWTEPPEFPNGGRHVGRSAVRDYLERSRAMWAEFSSSVTVELVGSRIVAVHSVSGRLVDGSEHSNVVADVYRFTDGLVVEMTGYADPETGMAAALAAQSGLGDRRVRL